MTKYSFNIKAVSVYNKHEYDTSLIESTPNFRQASLEDAYRLGNDLVKSVIDNLDVDLSDQAFIDTKITYLLPGTYPSIPGWHTDGVPRGDGSPKSKGKPNLKLQKQYSERGVSSKFYTLIVGLDCRTVFLDEQLSFKFNENDNLYESMTKKVNKLEPSVIKPEPNRWVSWDWWNIHRASPAENSGWRALFRITDSMLMSPRKDNIIRKQNQVYVPTTFGW